MTSVSLGWSLSSSPSNDGPSPTTSGMLLYTRAKRDSNGRHRQVLQPLRTRPRRTAQPLTRTISGDVLISGDASAHGSRAPVLRACNHSSSELFYRIIHRDCFCYRFYKG
jgi:hypothetical protein